MKKTALLFLALMLWINTSHATHLNVSSDNTTIAYVSDVKDEIKYYYTATNSGTSATWYHLIAPYKKGHIKEIRITSSSTNLAAYIQEKVEVLPATVFTIIGMTGISGDYSPKLGDPRAFINRDTTQTESLYLYIVPTVATGTWTLSITYSK